MNTNTMPLEAETRVLIDRRILGGSLREKIRMFSLNSLRPSWSVKNWAASVQITFCTLKKVKNHSL